MILVIDNYDSFTFNLVQALQAAGADVRVVRNDAIDREGIEGLASDADAHLTGIVISPGPGDPDDAGVSMDAVRVAALSPGARLPMAAPWRAGATTAVIGSPVSVARAGRRRHRGVTASAAVVGCAAVILVDVLERTAPMDHTSLDRPGVLGDELLLAAIRLHHEMISADHRRERRKRQDASSPRLPEMNCREQQRGRQYEQAQRKQGNGIEFGHGSPRDAGMLRPRSNPRAKQGLELGIALLFELHIKCRPTQSPRVPRTTTGRVETAAGQ